MLKLKLQYFSRLKQRADSFEKILMPEKIDGGRRGDRGWGGWMESPTQWTWVWVNSGSWWWTGSLVVLPSIGLQSWSWLSDSSEWKAVGIFIELLKVKVAHSCPTLCDSPWNSPGQNIGVGSLCLLQQIFPTQELNQGLLHCRQILYQLNYQGSHGAPKCPQTFLLWQSESKQMPPTNALKISWYDEHFPLFRRRNSSSCEAALI